MPKNITRFQLLAERWWHAAAAASSCVKLIDFLRDVLVERKTLAVRCVALRPNSITRTSPRLPRDVRDFPETSTRRLWEVWDYYIAILWCLFVFKFVLILSSFYLVFMCYSGFTSK